ncbi:MAG: ATP-grasp domain-containing protein [Pirellulales bacterium]|nr:ATP-grasp domain-containing protein [Pirellulales bacterium]
MSANLLFTSAGRRVELLRSFRQAYQRLGIEGRIIASDIDTLAPALRVADVSCLVPRLDSPEYIPALLEIVRREHVSAVFPLIDPDVPILATHRRLIEDAGAKLAVVGEEAAAIAADKWRTGEFFTGLRLPAPRSWLPGQCDLHAAEYPLVVKPRFGSASQNVFRVRNAREAEFFSEYVPSPIIQECLPGPEITNDVICDLEGRLLAVVSRERIRAHGGEVLIGKTVFFPEILEGCVRIAEALPAVGPITVQCMMREGEPVFTEINARFGGGAPLGIAAGADSPTWLLASVTGTPCCIPSLGSYRRNVVCSRYHEAYYTE